MPVAGKLLSEVCKGFIDLKNLLTCNSCFVFLPLIQLSLLSDQVRFSSSAKLPKAKEG